MAKLKPEHHDIIAAMGDAGKTDKQIARALKTRFGFEISPSAISWHRLRLGAEPDHRVKVRPVPEQPRVAMRGGRPVRAFTQAEDAALLALLSEGLTHTEIGARIGRRSNTVRARLMILARHDARRERAAEQNGISHG